MTHAIWFEPGVGFKVQPGIILRDVPIRAVEVYEPETGSNVLLYYPDLREICRMLDRYATM